MFGLLRCLRFGFDAEAGDALGFSLVGFRRAGEFVVQFAHGSGSCF
jgi:hypothetical protein